MRKYTVYRGGIILGILCLLALPLQALGEDQAQTVQQSIEVIKEMARSKEIPPEVLQSAQGIAVVPGLTKIAIGVGGEHGRGVAVGRVNGEWSPPVFINLSGGSLGAQIGVTTTDVVLVFQDKNSFQKMLSSNFELGADASLAAGSEARGYTATARTADVLAYQRVEGAFAGVSLTGSMLSVDRNANQTFYNDPNIAPQQIVAGRDITVPAGAEDLNAAVKEAVSPSR